MSATCRFSWGYHDEHECGLGAAAHVDLPDVHECDCGSEIDAARPGVCRNCGGSGGDPLSTHDPDPQSSFYGQPTEPCPVCGGTGRNRQRGQRMSDDRLAEIKAMHASYRYDNEHAVDWLIAEVARLREAVTTLEETLAGRNAHTDRAPLERLAKLGRALFDDPAVTGGE